MAEHQAIFAGRRSGLSPAAVLIWSIGLLLAGWAGWSAYSGYETGKARATAERVIAGQRYLNGYPGPLCS